MSGCVGDGEDRGGGRPVGGGEGGGAPARAPAAGEGDRRRRPVRAGGVRPGVSGRGQVEELEVPVPEAGAGEGSVALLVPDLRPVDDGPRRRRLGPGSLLYVRLFFFFSIFFYFVWNVVVGDLVFFCCCHKSDFDMFRVGSCKMKSFDGLKVENFKRNCDFGGVCLL